MNPPYHSFLICFHPRRTDVFRNGLPIGIVQDNVFTVHKTIDAAGREFIATYPATLTTLVKDVIEKMEEKK